MMTTEATQKTTEERTAEILQAARQLIQEHDQWANDPTTPEAPSQRVQVAADILIETAASGDIPADCRELAVAVAEFGQEWRAYENGRQMPGGLPMRSLWNAYNGITHCLTIAERPKTKRIESVAELRRQSCSDIQIARAYGSSSEINGTQVWSGPFFDSFGSVRSDLIEKEYQEPGSVIPPNWVHPNDRDTSNTMISNLHAKLQQLRADSPSASTEDPVQMLRDGAFPGQVATVCGMTIEAVHHLAAENGIAVESRTASEIYAQAATTPEPSPAGQTVPQQESQTAQSQSVSQLGKDELKSLVYEIADENPTHGAPDIVRELRETYSVDSSAKQVAAILRHRK